MQHATWLQRGGRLWWRCRSAQQEQEIAQAQTAFKMLKEGARGRCQQSADSIQKCAAPCVVKVSWHIICG
jgi:hypothetical protein